MHLLHLLHKMGTCTRFYMDACVLRDECSAASWGRTRKCQSFEGVDDVIANYKRHLMTSEKHYHRTEEEIDDVVSNVVVLEEEVPSDWFASPAEPHPKRQTGISQTSSASSGVERPRPTKHRLLFRDHANMGNVTCKSCRQSCTPRC